MNTPHAVMTLALAGLGLLAACGADPCCGPDPTITVRGLVRERGGDPISGAAVVVDGKNPVTTDADGRFSIPGVAVPYDLTLLLSSSNTAFVYEGLTRADPALLTLDRMGAVHGATVRGTTPPAPGRLTFVFFQSGRHVTGGGYSDTTTGQYAIAIPWQGSATTLSGDLYVLRWTKGPTSAPASYDAYTSRPLTISDGRDFPDNNFVAGDLTDPPEQDIGGMVAVPGGYTQTLRRLCVFFRRIPVIWEEQAPTILANAFTYAVPAVSGAVFVAATSEDPALRVSFFFKHGISGNSVNSTLPLEPAPQLAFPADGATSVDAATPFSWSQGGGSGVNLFELHPSNSSDPTYIIFTTGTDAKIPDLAGAGMALPVGATYTWVVDRVFPVASVNDAVADDFLQFADLETGDFGETLSEARTFTTRAAAGSALRQSAVGPTAAVSRSLRRRGWVLTSGALASDGR